MGIASTADRRFLLSAALAPGSTLHHTRRPQRLLILCSLLLQLHSLPLSAAEVLRFAIPAGTLADALDQFSETSGLQFVYSSNAVRDARTPAVDGAYEPAAVLNLLLEKTTFTWRFIDTDTVMLTPRSEPVPSVAEQRTSARSVDNGPALLDDMLVLADTWRVLPTEPTAIALGLAKPLLETPRSLSVISAETIGLFGLSAVEDLSRVVPAAYTTTRFGIQGAVDVRNVSADTYVRGMKRLNLQGHGRSVLGATDSIEIVRGPPSPLYGMGKIGGYTNVIPKSGRASLGGYLTDNTGFTQLVLGQYDRAELSFGLGGPLGGARRGGYYLYGLLEDSDTYTRNVGIGQTVLQGAVSVDDAIGGFRLEAGIDFQRSTTSGALLNRVTQRLVDHGEYVTGLPLIDLDANGNGSIGFLEMQRGSPVSGELSAANQPLIQRWEWPRDAQGVPLPLNEFPQLRGIPSTLYDYLQAHPDADPTGLLRAQGPGGPLPVSGSVPVGFALDPRSVGKTTLDLRRAGAYERDVRADFLLAYVELIHDSNADFTLKNQLFFDSMDQYKLSEQPGGGKQDVWVVEDKFTVTRRLGNESSSTHIDALLSVNARDTIATGYRYVGDQGSHRTDASYANGDMTPNTTFTHPFDNPVLNADGAPWNSDYRTDYWEAGVGGLLDIGLGARASLLLGGRIDRSRAKNVEYAGTLDPFVGTASLPGRIRTADERARGYDSGTSWHISFSYRLPFGLHPYATLAESSLTLESNNNRIANSVIQNGHIGKARLYEAGIKTSQLNDRLYGSLAYYEQQRLDVNDDNYLALQTANVSATATRGIEAELKWVPMENLSLSIYGLRQTTRFTPNAGDVILVDARTLGFKDVVDATGKVIYPAEAFLYGGRSFLVLPPGLPAYAEKQGNPQTQLGISGQYRFNRHAGLTFSGNYFSSVHSGRLREVELPASHPLNVGVFFDYGNWHCKLDITNLLDERYFRARTGDNLGETLISAMPGRQWLITIRKAL